jgi:hypothetical protein
MRQFVIRRTSAWYVPRALGERPSATQLTVPRQLILPLLLIASAIAVAACGGGSEPQDANEPSGEFEVEVTKSEFPTKQRLAETSDLVLGVENTGDEPLPELAITIETASPGGDGGGVAESDSVAEGSFDIRSDQPGLANPNRPVWILENKYPREQGTPPPKGISGGFRAQTNTFGFGPLEPGEEKSIVWRLTPVQAGSYTLSYIVEAGLDGNAKAVTSTGDEVKGEFVVKISDVPPKARVNDAGKVVTQGG